MLTIEDNRNCPWTTNHNRFRGEAEEKEIQQRKDSLCGTLNSTSPVGGSKEERVFKESTAIQIAVSFVVDVSIISPVSSVA